MENIMADGTTFELMAVEKDRPRKDFSEIGRSGLIQNSGYIQEEFMQSLTGTSAIRLYKEMRDNDPIVGAVMMALLNLVRQASWTIEPFDDSAESEKDAGFVEECMVDLDRPWKEFIADVMSMVVFGWSFFEVVYKIRDGKLRSDSKSTLYDDGKIGWRKFGIRSQDSLDKWIFRDNGELEAITQRPAPNYDERTIPMTKGALFRTSVWKDNPEGRSILRNAYRPWYFKKRMEEVEGIGVERDLNGIPVAYVPPSILRSDASDEEVATRNAVEQMVRNIRNDSQAGLVLPAMFDDNGNQLFKVELMTTLGRRNFDTNAIINRMNKTVATSMLADFVLIGQEATGSFAMASSKTKVFSVVIGSYMDTITDQFNRHLIPRLFALNGKRDNKLPKMIHGDIETVDLDTLAVYINALSGAGLDLTGEAVREHLAATAGLPPTAVGVREVQNQPFFSGESTTAPEGMKPEEKEPTKKPDAKDEK
jgi:phage gp29-like protein